MNDINEIANAVFQEFVKQIQEQGLTITKIDEETGQIHIPNADGETMLVSLNSLIHYYYESRDENAVRDFVAKVVETAKPRKEPSWEEAKSNVYISLFPSDAKADNPLAKEVTGYFNRFVVLDTPTQTVWVMPDMLEKWGVSAEELEKQALENGNRLLAETELAIGDVEGHPLGSFKVRDRNLNAALLFAPALKDKVSKDFGWPIYAIIPEKVSCYFFGKDHYDYFEARIGKLVADRYQSARYVTPELLEFSDTGVRSICSWTMQMGHIVKFNS